MSVLIAPSILSADFAALGTAIAAVERGGADLIHVDVMDGHFVPNITIGPPVVSSIKRIAKVPLDVHLMIEEPDRYLDAFAEAGASMMSVHVEVLPHLHRTVHAIKGLGVRAGVVLNPSTPVVALEEIAADVDYVLVMSVNPGFGGQTFIPRSESKVRAVRALLDRAGNAAPVEIDGGIDRTNVARVVSAGASIIVAGSAVFHTPDPERATRELKAAAAGASIPVPQPARDVRR
jgi:ribulose-phosphate 3-epimerase